MKNVLEIIYTKEQLTDFMTHTYQSNKMVLYSIEEPDDEPIEIDEVEIEKIYQWL